MPRTGTAPLRVALHALLILLAAGTAAAAQSEAFSPKQIKLLIGFSPTGYGYDTYGRLLARHLGKYLPGNPAILPQKAPVRSISRTTSITPPPRTAARSPLWGAAWQWSRSLGRPRRTA